MTDEEHFELKENNKALVRRLVDEAFNTGQTEVVDELVAPEVAPHVKRSIEQWRAAFPDMRFAVIDLLGDGNMVAAHLVCSGTHSGQWRGHAPTGRHTGPVDQAYFFTLKDNKIVEYFWLDHTLYRLSALGLRA